MVEKKQKQSMRYSDRELETIKSTFAENDELLIAIRKHFLQLPMDALEQALLVTLKNDKLALGVLRKTFLPTIDGNAPFNQVIDLWMTVELKNKEPELAYFDLKSRELLINFLEQQLNLLEGVSTSEEIKVSEFTKIGSKMKAPEVYINFITRNTLVYHIEQQLSVFSILAGQKNETIEQTKERLRKDSSK